MPSILGYGKVGRWVGGERPDIVRERRDGRVWEGVVGKVWIR